MKPGKRIFITGITSGLMQHLVPFLDQEHTKIVALSRHPINSLADNIRYVKGDLNHINDWSEEMAGCDLVLHAAAVTHSRDERSYFEINEVATCRLIDLARESKVSHFALLSSHAAGPQSGAYGISKYRAEQYLRRNFEQWTIFRPAEITGTDKQEGIEKLIREALHKSFVFYPAGVPSKLSPIDVSDVCRIMHETLFRLPPQNKIITLTGPRGYTYREIIWLVDSIVKKRTRAFPIPKLLMKLAETALKITRLNFGFAPDQISRLYAVKEGDPWSGPLRPLESYIKTLVERTDSEDDFPS